MILTLQKIIKKCRMIHPLSGIRNRLVPEPDVIPDMTICLWACHFRGRAKDRSITIIWLRGLPGGVSVAKPYMG